MHEGTDPIRISFQHKDTNVLALADPRDHLEPSYFHANTIYFWGETLCSTSSCFERPPGWQHVAGVCLHALEHERRAPAQLHVVLSMKHFYFQVAKTNEDFASNGNPIAKPLLSYFRRRQALIPPALCYKPPSWGWQITAGPTRSYPRRQSLGLPGSLMLGQRPEKNS